jgi:hypothetical protein
LKKIVAMTETEDNGDSNRRYPQAKLTNQKASNKHTEAVGEGPVTAASADTKISTDKGITGKYIKTAAMTNKTEGSSDSRRQPQATGNIQEKTNGPTATRNPSEGLPSSAGWSHGGNTASTGTSTGMPGKGLMEGYKDLRNQNGEEAAQLSQTWPTPKESTRKTTTTMMTRPTYPIFQSKLGKAD